MRNDWMDKNVLIIGAARQGLALARFLVNRGANVTLNDGRSEIELKDSITQLKDLPIQWVLGAHPVQILNKIDLVCISGGVPLDIPMILEAKKQNILLSNDSQIFMEYVKCPVVGITGSAGKTTTTALMGEIAKLASPSYKKVWVGGNIGNPLINEVTEIADQDLVILELSSFQLELMTKSPNIALITNITPNHLDRHGTLEAYTAAKAHILSHQSADDIAILNRDDPGAIGLRNLVKGKFYSYGFDPIFDLENGSFVQDNQIWINTNGQIEKICPLDEIPLLGRHNIYNVLAAVTISKILEFETPAIRIAIHNFKGVAHRLDLVRDWNGIKWIDDSIATAPERTLAAIEAIDKPIVLLLGGKDKNLPWEKLLQRVNEKVDHVILFGHAAEKINEYIQKLNFKPRNFSLHICTNLEQAVLEANKVAEPGDHVLLSPGGTSYDEFKDFEERGEMFKSWVQQL